MTQGPTLADATGTRRLQKLQERSKHIDDQIAELTDKKGLIEHEIRELRKELYPTEERQYCDPCERTEPECGECRGPPILK
jgi:predicted  nucleic acid-binding Zn-ribbon protein